ncbi:MAG: hypothetical protein GWO41_14250 [candidate division Zixibacteria bacterium]|jgi:hypothetical protein|nr:hypothetical protein [candidate division Zixibacteria bacterium]NIR63406.1 hypothetical protein [candidate division Zixibacteria bacterium]NIS17552.1 hypothetical protein [candidate division Zixibacteria bacterium]NIS45514.1 hypothetical protein [candidate division Zixibacteria bacterium]NIT53855.1 hypothetical protein [candidate division Zixibacteria bacterium]
MKKFLTFILIMLFLSSFALIGCGGQEEEPAETMEETTEEGMEGGEMEAPQQMEEPVDTMPDTTEMMDTTMQESEGY